MKISPDNWTRFLERILPWFVLLIVLTYTTARFTQVPYAGFRYNGSGEVVEIYVDGRSENNDLRIGDHLQIIGEIPWEEFETNPSLLMFDNTEPNEVIIIQVQRGEQELTINWRFPGATLAEVGQRLNSEWWLPFVFWLGGFFIALLVRPRDIRWQLLIAFNFLTAVWLATGGFALTHIWGNLLVFKTAVWLSVPVYLHLHWVFPDPWGKLPTWLVRVAYGTAFIGLVLEWLQLLPDRLYLLGFLFALFGSLLLLVGRYPFRREERQDLNLILPAILLVFLPPLVFTAVQLAGITLPFYIQGGALMAFPAIPGVYFYTIYRHQLGNLQTQVRRLAKFYVGLIFVNTIYIILIPFILSRFGLANSTIIIGVSLASLALLLAFTSLIPFLLLPGLVGAYETRRDELRHRLEIRANHLLTPFLFIALLSFIGVTLVTLAEAYLQLSGAIIITGIIIGVLSGILTGIGYAPFRRFVNRHLLGIPLISEELSQQYLSHIVVSLSQTELVNTLRNEVLPALLIRQSTLYYITDPQQKERIGAPLYIQGFLPEELPERSSLNDFLVPSGETISPPLPTPWDWVKIVLPLHLSGQFMGVWLLGRRDPDDLYGQAEVATLQNIANQTAIALSHILQTDTLRALYQANIDRQEAERKGLAHNLHDEVLNRVIELGIDRDTSQTTAKFQQNYQEIILYLRQTISGLRPAMLTYGLADALEELVDELNDRSHKEITVSFKLKPSTQRYPGKVEEHLYRITQQATENALRHAHAQNVWIDGELEESKICIIVGDDGQGFAMEEPLNLPALVAQKHFGIAGMYERAALIGGQLTIDTNPHQGTTLTIIWQSTERVP